MSKAVESAPFLVEVDLQVLVDAARAVSPASAARSPRPAASCIRLMALDGNRLAVDASGGEVESRVICGAHRVDCKPGSAVLLDRWRLLQLLSGEWCEVVRLERRRPGDAGVILTDPIKGGSSYTVFGEDENTWLDLMSESSSLACDGFSCELAPLSYALQFGAAVHGSGAARNTPQGFKLDTISASVDGSGLHLAITDGRALSHAAIKGRQVKTKDGRPLDPGLLPLRLSRVVESIWEHCPTAHCVLRWDTRRFRIDASVGDVVVASVVGLCDEGSFPPWRDMIPKPGERRLAVRAALFGSAVAAVSPFRPPDFNQIMLEFEPTTNTLSVRTGSEAGYGHCLVRESPNQPGGGVEYGGPWAKADLRVAVNHKYLAAVAGAKAERLEFAYDKPTKPLYCTFSDQGIKIEVIIMPMQIAVDFATACGVELGELVGEVES